MKSIKHKLETKEYNGEPIYIQCCVCNRYRGKDDWYSATEEHNELISHTYCPNCLEIAIKEFKETKR